jgi:tripartite-type tricarboxylate transporter receptor subunit TctC
VPHKGSSPALGDLIGGHVSMYPGSMPASVPGAKRVRALPTGPRRAPAAPEVPTIAESGFPRLRCPWHGLFAPAGTPLAIIDQLHGAGAASSSARTCASDAG